jgi:hypothetical protein
VKRKPTMAWAVAFDGRLYAIQNTRADALDFIRRGRNAGLKQAFLERAVRVEIREVPPRRRRIR